MDLRECQGYCTFIKAPLRTQKEVCNELTRALWDNHTCPFHPLKVWLKRVVMPCMEFCVNFFGVDVIVNDKCASIKTCPCYSKKIELWDVRTAILHIRQLAMETFRARYFAQTERCVLCGGTGVDSTGFMCNGDPEPVCVRCGGYGSLPKGCPNPKNIQKNEIEQLIIEFNCGDVG